MKGQAILAMVSMVAVSVFAQGPNNPANFETAKANMSASTDKKMEILKEFKSCVDAAMDVKALKECKNKEMAAMKAMKPMMKKMPKNMDMNGSGMGMGQKSMM